MKKYANCFAMIVITAWIGGLWGIGYLAAPVLFQTLPDKMLAGLLAGKMFTMVSYLGIASACYLLVYYLTCSGKEMLRQPVFWVVVAMLLLTLVGQFGIQPIMVEIKELAQPADVMHSAYADRFRMLHGISSIAYLIQSLLGLFLVLKGRR
ncbi:MAG: DUF4149 domain-containing protein [Nitrosomonadales bacterium]